MASSSSSSALITSIFNYKPHNSTILRRIKLHRQFCTSPFTTLVSYSSKTHVYTASISSGLPKIRPFSLHFSRNLSQTSPTSLLKKNEDGPSLHHFISQAALASTEPHVALLPVSASEVPIFKNPPFSSRTLFSPRGYSTESQFSPSERVSSIVDELSELTLLEVSDLTDILRQKFNVQDMPVMGVMMPGMGFGMRGGGAKGEEVVEKTAFDLKLEGGFDASVKIKIIKEVRACTDLGLKEAKDLVEKAPTLLKKGVTKEEGEKIVAKLKEIGAKVTME